MTKKLTEEEMIRAIRLIKENNSELFTTEQLEEAGKNFNKLINHLNHD